MKQLVDTLAEYAQLLMADKASAVDPNVIDQLESADTGVFEGQIHIKRTNYKDFEAFKVNPRNICDKIKTLHANHEI